MTTFTNLIQGLSQQLGYEIEIIDDVCAIGSEDVTILLMGIVENQEENLVITSDLGIPPPQHLEKLYEEMMNAMFVHQTTGIGAFARNPQDGRLWLQRIEPLVGLTPEVLMSHISLLGEAAIAWKKIIADFRDVSPQNAASADASADAGWDNAFIQV